MKESRCAAHCNYGSGRRDFIKKPSILGAGTILMYPFGGVEKVKIH